MLRRTLQESIEYNVMRRVNLEAQRKGPILSKSKYQYYQQRVLPVVHPKVQTVAVAYGIEKMCDMG